MFRFLAFLLCSPSPPPRRRAAARAGTPALHLASGSASPSSAPGPDVVLIPGLSSTPAVWDSTIAARARLSLPSDPRLRLRRAGRPAPMRRGRCSSPSPSEIARYIREARLDRPAIVGHSMGGSWAILVAGRHPGWSRKVMVVDMMPYLGAMFRRPGSDRRAARADGRADAQRMLAGADGEQRRQSRPRR